MKHLKKYLYLIAFVATIVSCKKNVVEYNTTTVKDEAEFQLHYMVPVVASTLNNIYKVEINGVVVANNTNVLTTYNAIPSGSVGIFYTTKVGTNNIKLYRSVNLDLVYDQNVELTKGKQNIVVYDYNKPPIVFDAGYPFVPVVTDSTGKNAWVKFYNFLYETPGVPTALKLQYQRQYVVKYATSTTPVVMSDWINVGPPVAFGEATNWELIDVNKVDLISQGAGRVDYRIRMIDGAGNDIGPLVVKSGSTYKDYADYWNATIGRRYHHFFAGFRDATPTSGVRQFTAL